MDLQSLLNQKIQGLVSGFRNIVQPKLISPLPTPQKPNIINNIGNIKGPSGMTIGQAVKKTIPTVASDFGNTIRQPLKDVPYVSTLSRLAGNTGESVASGVVNLLRGGYNASKGNLPQAGVQGLFGLGQIAAPATIPFQAANAVTQLPLDRTARAAKGFMQGMTGVNTLAPEVKTKESQIGPFKFDPYQVAGSMAGFTKNPTWEKIFPATSKLFLSKKIVDNPVSNFILQRAFKGGGEGLIQGFAELPDNASSDQIKEILLRNVAFGSASEVGFEGGSTLIKKGISKAQINKVVEPIAESLSKEWKRLSRPVNYLDKDGQMITEPLWKYIAKNESGEANFKEIADALTGNKSAQGSLYDVSGDTVTLYRASPNLPNKGTFKAGTYFTDSAEKARYYSESHLQPGQQPHDIKIEKFILPKNAVFREPSTGNYTVKSDVPVNVAQLPKGDITSLMKPQEGSVQTLESSPKTAIPQTLQTVQQDVQSRPSQPSIPDQVKVGEQELNVNRLNLPKEGKELVKNLDSKEIRTRLGDKEVLKIAQDAGIDTKTYSIDETAKKIAEQLNLRKSVVSLTNELENTTDVGQRVDILKKIAEESKAARTQGTDVARQLSARRIIANELDTPVQRVFKLLDNAGVNPEVYIKKAAQIDFKDANQVTDFYRELVPAKYGDWLNEVRYNSMLSSPLTHIVNISSNLVNTGVVAPIEKTVTGSVDFFHSKLTGKKQKYFAGEGVAFVKGYYENAKPALDKMVDVLRGKSSTTNLDLKYAPAATKGVKGAISKTLRVPTTALEAMDQFFMALTEGGERKALEYRSSKGGSTGSLGDILTQSKENAQYRTFRQKLGDPKEGYLLNAVDTLPRQFAKWKNSKNPIVSNIARFTFPFVGTPTNIVKQGIEYSPAGFLTTLGAKNKTEQVAKAIMGTAASLGAATLLGSGRLSWAEPTDPDQKAAFRAAGKQPYAVKVGDKWLGYNKLPPVISTNLAMISALDDAVKNKKLSHGWVDAITSAAAKYGNFWADQSYFKQMGDLLAAVKGDPESVSRYFSNIPQQLVPMRAFSGWIARMTDEYQRKPDYNKSFIDQQVDQLFMNIPGLSQKLPARTDLKGDPIENQNRILNSFSPVRVTNENKDKLIQINESENGLSLFKALLKMPRDEANKYIDDLSERKPELTSKVEKYITIKKAGLGEPEMKMYGSKVKDGTRARMIKAEMSKLKTKEEKNAYLDKLDELNLTNDDVYNQLKYMGVFGEQPKFTLDNKTILEQFQQYKNR